MDDTWISASMRRRFLESCARHRASLQWQPGSAKPQVTRQYFHLESVECTRYYLPWLTVPPTLEDSTQSQAYWVQSFCKRILAGQCPTRSSSPLGTKSRPGRASTSTWQRMFSG